MNKKDFKCLCADINKMAIAFRQIEKMNIAILSDFGQSICKVYILLEQLAARAENKTDFRNEIEKEIIQARKPVFQEEERRLGINEICLLEDYLKQNFNPLDEVPQLAKVRQA